MAPSNPSLKARSWARPLAEFVGGALHPALAKQGFGQADIILSWKEIVGARLAGFCEPVRLQWPARGTMSNREATPQPATLIVRVEGAFALELQHLSGLIIERVNAHLGWRCVGRLALRQGPVGKSQPKRPAALPIDPATRQRAAALAEGIADDALREAVERLGCQTLRT